MPIGQPTRLVGVSTMLGGALGQFFIDLDKIPEPVRSDYEKALHKELLDLANRLRPLATEKILSGEELRVAIERTPELKVQIDLQPSDLGRVHCDEPRCPLKRK